MGQSVSDQSANYFAPDEKLVVYFAQATFDQCWKRNPHTNEYAQSMPDLKDPETGESYCWRDCENMRNSLEQYGITDTGPVENKNLYILNENATQTKVLEVMNNIKTRIEAEPNKKFLVVYVISGHGMSANGKQVVLLNEYNEASGFYKIWGVEAEIRELAKTYSNSY